MKIGYVISALRLNPLTEQIIRCWDSCTCFGCETKTGKVLFWLFFKIDLCSASSSKRSRQELSIDTAEHMSILKNYQNTHYSLIFKVNLCSATSMESSRRDLLNDLAEHRSVLRYNHKTYYPRISFTPKTGIELP